MTKNSLLALVTAAALAGIAAPAIAAPPPPEPAIEETGSDFDADYVLYLLQSKGVNALSVEIWGSYVRAFVTGEDGRETMRFFDPDTLAPVEL